MMYHDLLAEPGPKMLLEAIKLYGTLEAKGSGNIHIAHKEQEYNKELQGIVI